MDDQKAMSPVASTVDPPSAREVRTAHALEMRAATRTTGLAGGLLILVALPLWSIYDHLVEPDLADRFLALRLGVLVPILAGWLLLLKRPLGERSERCRCMATSGERPRQDSNLRHTV